ncbi:hypothetical protein LIA77_08807 [Sarocladium implicatum]|nr:hypothetical protein LIA77_08807 [Sarocladium implicatum]
MKSFPILLTALGLATTAVADFYLIGEVISHVEGVEDPAVKAVSVADRGSCDGIDNSPDIDGATGDNFFPYPEEEFRTATPLCGIALRFNKDGDNYKVVDDVTGDDAGYCTRGNDAEVKFCTWGLVSAEYVEDYFCQSWVCT